ncbi:MAG: NTP transferase domain-containing protein, partial [Sphingomonadales bacterium]|nr:NTP transferase domain-containing protein [Sphingomonadales bacterium]
MSQFQAIGIMLAAGSSRRMGAENKLLCQINNTTILEHSLNNFAQSKLKEIILVLGHEAETIAALPVVQKLKSEKKLSIVINKNY